MNRVYLDWNATTPLRPEARTAMLEAMDVLGNPSSVHAEGRAAKAIIERARGQISEAFGAAGADIIFTSSATEAATLAAHFYCDGLIASDIEHDCVLAQRSLDFGEVKTTGLLKMPMFQISRGTSAHTSLAVQAANSETGVVQDFNGLSKELAEYHVDALCDAVQSFGKIPIAFDWTGYEMALLSAHKIGGPKGVGALVVQRGKEIPAQIKGGGQEMGSRAGTENVIGIAGFAAAAVAAQRDLADGVWQRVAELRDWLEDRLMAEAPEFILFGKAVERLPNTSYFALPGWKGETQVMQMDLAGYAISAGAACSSGKVKASRVLLAMGFDEVTASSAIRVSIGPETTETEMMGFAEAWLAQYRRFKARAA